MSDAAQPQPEASARLRGARGFVLSFAGLLLFIEALLSLTALPPADAPPRDAQELRARLRAFAESAPALQQADPQASRWLLLGDSVLVGDTGADELPAWASHRLIDYMRGELRSDEDARFEQVALDGMLPVDMLAIVEALDLEDPEGHVSLVVELSPRHFSPSYAEDPSHSRAWLGELVPGEISFERVLAPLRRFTPIYRHRARFRGLRERLDPASHAGAADGRAPEEVDSEAEAERDASARLAAFARLSVHYREPALNADSVQVQALLALVERCRGAGRKLVLFTTPLEDHFAARVAPEGASGELLGQLDRLLQPNGRTRVLLPMDHPLFASAMFWDHVHLRPEGHRLLALNLLTQLGLGLERAPSEQELIARPGFDTSLVARIELGANAGAAWEARFDHPDGLALAPGGRRLVVADTRNHVLRLLHDDMRVVSTLVGEVGEAGDADGSLAQARLRAPRAPLFVGERLYFADDGGQRLRELANGEVSTLTQLEAGWRVVRMRAGPGPAPTQLLTLEQDEAETRVVSHAREQGRAQLPRVLLRSQGSSETQMVAFTLGPDGGAYVATAAGEILHFESSWLGATKPVAFEQATLVFARPEHEHVHPQGQYPKPFSELRLSQIADLIYVERYGGLLVQDYTPHPKPGKYNNPVTERAQLRFLDLERELVYPWVKPLVTGVGYSYANSSTGGVSSYFHEGSMALDPDSRALYYLEFSRSRLLRVEDGLLGLAKVSAYGGTRLGFNSPIGGSTGKRAFAHYHPPRPVAPASEAPALLGTLGGPYELLLVGSSMISMSEIVGEYSLGRLLIARLERELALRDRVRLHGFQRTLPGGAFHKQIKAVRRFIEAGGRPDLVLIDVNGSVFIKDEQDDAEIDALLAELLELTRRWHAELIFYDTSPYIVRNREPLRVGPPRVVAFLDMLEQRGLSVLRVEDLVLDASLEVAPFASPPIRSIHAPSWAIEAVADEFGAALVPMVRALLDGRKPAATRSNPREGEAKSTKTLAEAFARAGSGAEFEWETQLPSLPSAALQYSNEGSTLVAFIDLTALPELAALPEQETQTQAQLDALMLAVIYAHSVRLRDGAERAEISFGRFAAYDEYGAGVQAGASIVARERLDHGSLRALAETFIRAHSEPQD